MFLARVQSPLVNAVFYIDNACELSPSQFKLGVCGCVRVEPYAIPAQA